MSLRNKIFKLISPALFLILTDLYFLQPFQRELNIIPVTDAEGPLKNIFSGGHNNLEHQFVDIDDDTDLEFFIWTATELLDGLKIKETGLFLNYNFHLTKQSA